MPEVDEALPKAVGYFRRAAARRQGEAKGKTLKAMVQALEWQDILGMTVDAKETIALASEALSLLPIKSYPGEHAELTHWIQRFQGKEAESELPRAGAAADVHGTQT